MIAGAFVHCAATTWLKWGELIIDCGAVLDIPKQLVAGKALYGEVRHYFGPLEPWINAGLYALFEVSSQVIVGAGLTTAALTAWVVYRLTRLFLSRPGAALSAIAFIYVLAFARYHLNGSFNFIFPYTCSATYGTLAAVSSVYFLVRHTRKWRSGDFLLSCLLLALTALTKPEILFAAGLAHVAFLGMALHQAGRRGLAHLAAYALMLVPLVGIYGYFYWRLGPALIHDYLFTSTHAGVTKYSLERAGLADVQRSLKELGRSLGGLLLAAGVSAGAGWALHTYRRAMPAAAGAAPLLAALALSVLLVSGAVAYWLDTELTFRALPLLLATALAAMLILYGRRRALRPELSGHVVLFVFALASLARMPLRASAELYGFYQLVPGLAAFVVICLGCLPVAVSFGRPQVRPNVRGFASILLVAILAVHAYRSWQVYRQITRVISTPRGTMTILGGPYGAVLAEAVEYLRTLPRESEVVVVPEGAGLTFFAGLTNPLGIYTFLPVDFVGSYDDEGMVRRFAAADPEYVVFVPRDVREEGYKGFGIDYALPLARHILSCYEQVYKIGGRASIRVFHRRPAPPP